LCSTAAESTPTTTTRSSTDAETLLARIQADVRADHQPPGALLPRANDERPLLDSGDLSLRVHSCHGRACQVEVVRDAILHALREDPTLQPRDVIVMCPDIAFAPLIQASFGAGELPGDDELPADVRPVDLRLRLADRALRQKNPVLGVIADLVELAGERLTASQVLDLADREPVRRRFGLDDDDDLGRVQRWIADSGIRWGLDAAHRVRALGGEE
jgi:exodeoxyribonuclease V gamma subunit